jgi:hypothetical protein
MPRPRCLTNSENRRDLACAVWRQNIHKTSSISKGAGPGRKKKYPCFSITKSGQHKIVSHRGYHHRPPSRYLRDRSKYRALPAQSAPPPLLPPFAKISALLITNPFLSTTSPSALFTPNGVGDSVIDDVSGNDIEASPCQICTACIAIHTPPPGSAAIDRETGTADICSEDVCHSDWPRSARCEAAQEEVPVFENPVEDYLLECYSRRRIPGVQHLRDTIPARADRP